MKQLLVLPTWLIIRVIQPLLPQEHDWKFRTFNLKDWAKHSTELNNAFSLFFWVSAVCVGIVIYALLTAK